MNHKKSILFFLSHQPNPRFIKQINFLSKKNEVTVVYFSRENNIPDLVKSFRNDIVHYNLGTVKNLNITPKLTDYFKRFLIYFKTIGHLRKLNRTNKFNTILVNNIDVLIIYIISCFGFFKKNIYTIEISDLQEFVFYNTFTSKIVRLFERFLFKYFVDKLIVTSQKYYDFHFSKFFKKDVFVLENKILSNEISIKSHSILNNENINKTVIGIVGCLLRKDEYLKLFNTYKDSKNIEIHVYGTGPFKNIVEEYANNFINIKYFGKYNAFNDSFKIYNSIDILYVVYDNDLVSKNNKLALPNKLYEAMYFKVPLICSEKTYLAEIIEKFEIGFAIDYKIDNEIDNAVNMIIKDKLKINNNFKRIKKENFIADEDYLRFSEFLEL